MTWSMQSEFVRRHAVGLLALLAIVLCAPRPAKAQWCGSHVSWSGDLTAAMATLHEQVEAQHGATPEPVRSPMPPCQGPSCSRAPEAPPLSPMSVDPPTVEPWALLGLALHSDGPPTGRLRAVPFLSVPEHRPSGVFHPPRALPTSPEFGPSVVTA